MNTSRRSNGRGTLFISRWRYAIAGFAVTILLSPAPTPAADAGPSGAALYEAHCASCHAADGSGNPATGMAVPALNNPDVLAVADDDYYRRIVANGRSGTLMQAWNTTLSPAEIEAVVAHIRSWDPPGAAVETVSARAGRAAVGEPLYNRYCAPCHGANGEGGIGISLRAPEFLAIADDRFLAESIIHGRPGTAMPAWRQLAPQAVSDILAFLRSWQSDHPNFAEVADYLESAEPEESIRTGKDLYLANCATCHGADGMGLIGPSVTSPDFLGAIDAVYLYLAIVQGRPGTAMPAWRHLGAADVGALIAYLQSHPASRPDAPLDLPTGDAAAGADVYRRACLSCHGDEAIGGSGPQLGNPVFLGIVSDHALARWITFGRKGTAMVGFGPQEKGDDALSAQQIADVIAYLRSLAGTPDVPRHAPVLSPAPGRADVGASIFGPYCASCHGMRGEGGIGPQLNNPTFLRTVSDGFLAASMVIGRTGSRMGSRVHGGEGVRQADPSRVPHLIAYMRSWGDEAWRETRRPRDMSVVALRSGREVYARNCASCHGPDGRGSGEGTQYVAPALNNPEFLHAVRDGTLEATIVRGREHTGMPPFGPGAGGVVELSPLEIRQVVSFIRSWETTSGDSARAPEM